jgi:hypothetical protein
MFESSRDRHPSWYKKPNKTVISSTYTRRSAVDFGVSAAGGKTGKPTAMDEADAADERASPARVGAGC